MVDPAGSNLHLVVDLDRIAEVDLVGSETGVSKAQSVVVTLGAHIPFCGRERRCNYFSKVDLGCRKQVN